MADWVLNWNHVIYIATTIHPAPYFCNNVSFITRYAAGTDHSLRRSPTNTQHSLPIPTIAEDDPIPSAQEKLF
jgi:hypothetical protein